MKQKKLVIIFIVLSLSLILTLPTLNCYFLYSNGQLNKKNLDKKHLLSTDNLEAIRNYIFYKVPKISLNKEQTIVGKDDFLFLGNHYNSVVDKTKGTYSFTEKDIDIWTNKLKGLQEWYESRNIKFAIIIASNKHTIYNDKLPNNVIYTEGKTITDTIVKMAEEKNIHILNLKDSLKRRNNKDILYFRTDTHWTNKAASIGFNETIKYLNSIYHTKYKKPTYHFIKGSGIKPIGSADYYTLPQYYLLNKKSGSGDLAKFLKINTLLPDEYEKDLLIKLDKDYSICHGFISSKHKIEKCTFMKNQYMWIGNKDQYMINKKSLNGDKLLWLCDSFGTANSLLYNATFNTIWKFHYGHINGNDLALFVDKHEPDLVIYQIVERSLYNNSIVKKLSMPNIIPLDYNIKLDNDTKIFDINDTNFKYYKNNQLTINNGHLKVNKNDPIIILNKLKSKSKFVILNYDLSSTKVTTFQLFYKDKPNDSYNENSSYKVTIKKGINEIKLKIPSKFINNQLRIDLVGERGDFTIEDFSIYSIK